MSFVVTVIAKSVIILTAAAAVCIVFRRASAATRHAVWVLAIVGGLLLPFASAIVPAVQLPVWPETASTVRSGQATMSSSIVATARALESPTSYSVREVMPMIWGVVLSLLLARFLAGALGVRRLAQRAKEAENGIWENLLPKLLNELECRKRVRLLFSSSEVSPMTWGIWRHAILLPSSARDWSVERARLVLAHEIAHVKRNDGFVHLFVQLACSIYWFNPLIWFAARGARIERERACDDYVLNLGGTAADYADHLIQIVRGLRAERSLAFAALSMAQPSQLESRLHSILDPQARRRALSKVAMTFLCASTAVITLSVAGINVTGAMPLPLPPIILVTASPAPPVETTASPKQRTHIGNNGAATASTVTPPQVIVPTAPLYADVEGSVTLEASVDVQGNISVLRVVKGLTSELDQRAIDEAASWKFSPALKDGVPVSAITQIEVDFKLPPERLRPGGNVRPPTVISRVEPQYSDEARQAHYQGTVVLEALIRKDGTVDILRVVHAAGYGLDANAIAALKQWVFKPGTKNGNPVDVALNIEVNFNLRDDPPAAGAPRGAGGFQLKINAPQ